MISSLSIAGWVFLTIGDLISVAGRWRPVYARATYHGTKGRRQERLDRSQQVVESYRFSDTVIASAVQGVLFVPGVAKALTAMIEIVLV